MDHRSRRVAEHAVAIAHLMAIPDKRIKEIEIAALLRDIGKANFPLFMLEKSPNDYSPEEMAIYKYHPQACSEILKNVYGYEQIIELVHYHHEKYNGSGFPSGHKTSKTPMGAYIIGITDYYDHLVENKTR